MKILIIQGPNLNLIGVKSAKLGKRTTLDKINKGIRRFIREKDIEVKIYQTHSVERVITLLQRNRNWAEGIIIAPGAWSIYETVITDTLQLIDIPTIEVHDENENEDYIKNSILSVVCKEIVTAPPEEMFVRAIQQYNR